MGCTAVTAYMKVLHLEGAEMGLLTDIEVDRQPVLLHLRVHRPLCVPWLKISEVIPAGAGPLGHCRGLPPIPLPCSYAACSFTHAQANNVPSMAPAVTARPRVSPQQSYHQAHRLGQQGGS